MTDLDRDILLIDDLRSQSSERALVEFKENNYRPDMVGRLCSALSNKAALEVKQIAFVLWGIRDSDRKVVGTDFDPDALLVANTVFQLWLSQRLSPDLAVSFRSVGHPDGKVVILEIPAAAFVPVSFDNISYIRIGSATPKLADHSDSYRKLIENLRSFNWEKGVAKSFVSSDDVTKLLDYPTYFNLTEKSLPSNAVKILEIFEAEQLITADVGGFWNITNMGAILFAHDLRSFEPSLARKGVRFTAYEGKDRSTTVTNRIDGVKGYATGLSGVVDFIKNLLPQNEHIGSAFRVARRLYPERAIRELIVNSLMHQDMTVSGAGPQIELFQDRLEFTNPGSPLIEINRMIDLPPRSRNESLASLMRRLRMCEEEGSGLDKVIIDVELFQLPAPKFQSEADSMRAVLYAPRSFADMSQEERIRACYQHAVIRYLSGSERMRNSSLCERFGIERKNAAQATSVINATLDRGLIQVADRARPRAGYVPIWADQM